MYECCNRNVTFEDNGIGIPDCETKEVFQAFYRGSNDAGGDLEGAGMEQGQDNAFRFLLDIRNLDMQEVWPDEATLWRAAELKQVGLTDLGALTVASASARDAVLVHKRSEYSVLGKTHDARVSIWALDISSHFGL